MSRNVPRAISEHHALMIERDAQRRGVETGERLEEPAAARFAAMAPGAQKLGAQHRHKGERDHGGNDDRRGERDRKLMEEAPDDVAHEQERDQNRDQRHGERDDGEADLRRPLHRRIVGSVALLEKAGDVLDHHDRVVDDEAGRDGQRHQGQIIEAEAGLIHDRQRADQRQRHRETRDEGRRDVAQEDEYDHHHQADRQRKLEFDVFDGGADGGRAVGQRLHRDRRRQRLAERGQKPFDAVHHLDDVGAGLALNVDDQRRSRVHPGLQAIVLGRDLDPGDVGQPDRRAVAVGDDRFRVIVRVADLIVGVDRRGLRRPVEISLWRVDVEVGDRGAQIVEVEADARQGERIDVDADGGPLSPRDRHQSDAGELRQFRHEAGFDDVLDVGQLHRVRSDAKRQNRGVGRIDLGVDRRRRQVGWQKIACGVDRRLHLLLGDVETDVEAEPQGDDRRPGGALRHHLAQARHLAELPLERRRHRRSHHLRARARIEGLNLDRRIVDLGQGRERQEAKRQDADEQNRDHQETGRDRTIDEDAGGVHHPAPGGGGGVVISPGPEPARRAPGSAGSGWRWTAARSAWPHWPAGRSEKPLP